MSFAYRTRYGYPWRWAILAELAWRLEHLPRWGEDDAGEHAWLGRIGNRAYRWRKGAERRGSGRR